MRVTSRLTHHLICVMLQAPSQSFQLHLRCQLATSTQPQSAKMLAPGVLSCSFCRSPDEIHVSSSRFGSTHPQCRGLRGRISEEGQQPPTSKCGAGCAKELPLGKAHPETVSTMSKHLHSLPHQLNQHTCPPELLPPIRCCRWRVHKDLEPPTPPAAQAAGAADRNRRDRKQEKHPRHSMRLPYMPISWGGARGVNGAAYMAVAWVVSGDETSTNGETSLATADTSTLSAFPGRSAHRPDQHRPVGAFVPRPSPTWPSHPNHRGPGIPRPEQQLLVLWHLCPRHPQQQWPPTLTATAFTILHSNGDVASSLLNRDGLHPRTRSDGLHPHRIGFLFTTSAGGLNGFGPNG